MTDALPESIAIGALLVLLLRSLLGQLPVIIASMSKALTERATAERLAEQTSLEKEQRGRDHDERREHEIDELRDDLDKMRQQLADTERMATEAIHAAEIDHAATRERLDACEEDLAKCTAEHARTKAQLAAIHREMRDLRASIDSKR